MTAPRYEPRYVEDWALVVGINNYTGTSPLAFARQDAEAFAAVLRDRLGFARDNVRVLLDSEATRERILSEFLSFETVNENDRVVFFFAGHGMTRSGRRGEVGYLVPVDGDPEVLSSLVRWDDLTRNSELIPAKHIAFFMDACYGGLAITRALPRGSERFLKDMLQRYARQVLTAGKADEVVADAGGPRPGHSIFTGHLLDALEGAVASPDGVISTNAVMAYVYDHVATDPHSFQTPHFGFLDGDGDLILAAPNLASLDGEEGTDSDVLIPTPVAAPADSAGQELIGDVKDLIASPHGLIRLDDIATEEIRRVLHDLGSDRFELDTPAAELGELVKRIEHYERSTTRLKQLLILVARWGREEHMSLIELALQRIGELNERPNGLRSWVGLTWYPLLILLYSAGIGAIHGRNYRSLRTLFEARLENPEAGRHEREAAVVVVQNGFNEAIRSGVFKLIPEHARHFVPESEYLFKAVQPDVEDLLFLGKGYEGLFDRFEVLFALSYADTSRTEHYVWGPVGRFGWKYRRDLSKSPFHQLVSEAAAEGDAWPPLLAGMFGGSAERFSETADLYRQHVLDSLRWF